MFHRVDAFERDGRYADALGELERIAHTTDEASVVCEALRRAAAIAGDKLGDLDRAADAYRKLLDLDGAYENALDGLATILESRADWQRLVSVLERKVDIAAETHEVVGTLLRVARIREEQLGDPQAAAESARRVLDFEPDHPEAKAILTRLG